MSNPYLKDGFHIANMYNSGYYYLTPIVGWIGPFTTENACLIGAKCGQKPIHIEGSLIPEKCKKCDMDIGCCGHPC